MARFFFFLETVNFLWKIFLFCLPMFQPLWPRVLARAVFGIRLCGYMNTHVVDTSTRVVDTSSRVVNMSTCVVDTSTCVVDTSARLVFVYFCVFVCFFSWPGTISPKGYFRFPCGGGVRR